MSVLATAGVAVGVGLVVSNWEKELILDQEAFQQAANDMNNLATQVDNLKKEIEDMLTELISGFDTPAGHRLVEACHASLLDQMTKQGEIIRLASENLSTAITTYQNEVFNEYDKLVSTFNS